MKRYYVATGTGCCIRRGKSEATVRRAVLREVGTNTGIKLVREATEKDLSWVRGMGGRVP